MKLIQWTLFIDMLGYRDINGSINSDSSAEEFISFMESNREILGFSDGPHAVEVYKGKGFNLYEFYDIGYCFVSDSLIITYKPKEVDELNDERVRMMHSANALFIILMRLQTIIFNCFSEKGLFLRGGISNKYCYIKDSFAVGEGLIEAYEAESVYASHPRILLHPAVEENERLMESISILEKKMYGGKKILERDDKDGMLFMNYLGYNIATVDRGIEMINFYATLNEQVYENNLSVTRVFVNNHAEKIERKILELNKRIEKAADDKNKKTLESVLDKFVWLKEYHNSTVSANPWLGGRLVS